MALGWVGWWRLKRAAKRHGKRVGETLLRDYGASEFYTPRQIEHAVAKAGLPRKYLALAQAWFLPEQQFNRLNPDFRLGGYAEMRVLFRRYCGWVPASAAFEPIGVSAHIDAGFGIR